MKNFGCSASSVKWLSAFFYSRQLHRMDHCLWNTACGPAVKKWRLPTHKMAWTVQTALKATQPAIRPAVPLEFHPPPHHYRVQAHWFSLHNLTSPMFPTLLTARRWQAQIDSSALATKCERQRWTDLPHRRDDKGLQDKANARYNPAISMPT